MEDGKRDYYWGHYHSDEQKAVSDYNTTLAKHLEIWGQYGANKHPKTDSEKVLLDTAAKYLNELKASGGSITPKKWTSDKSRLTAQKNMLYEKMKSMREEIKAVESIRKNAEQLAKTETPPRKEQWER